MIERWRGRCQLHRWAKCYFRACARGWLRGEGVRTRAQVVNRGSTRGAAFATRTDGEGHGEVSCCGVRATVWPATAVASLKRRLDCYWPGRSRGSDV